jgi:biopolymer transport protein TolR
MALYISKRKLKVKEEDEMGELNIVPYLDILMNLIIFMLLSMTGLATFGVVNVSAPAYGAGAGAGSAETPLLLTVAISKKGFYLAATGGVLPGQDGVAAAAPGEGAPTVPALPSGALNYKQLSEEMKKIKATFPQETKIILVAEADTKYEDLVATMDATRETEDKKLLFPDVTLASF